MILPNGLEIGIPALGQQLTYQCVLINSSQHELPLSAIFPSITFTKKWSPKCSLVRVQYDLKHISRTLCLKFTPLILLCEQNAAKPRAGASYVRPKQKGKPQPAFNGRNPNLASLASLERCPFVTWAPSPLLQPPSLISVSQQDISANSCKDWLRSA